MRIAFYGNFTVDFSSESHHAKSLEALGHEVIRVQEPTLTGGDLAKILASGCDLFVWVHTHGANMATPGMRGLVSSLKARDIPIIAYHLDLYLGIPGRFAEYKDDPYFTQVDYFFTADGPLAAWLNTTPGAQGFYLPPGVYHEEATYEPQEPRYDVIFVGSYGYHPEWPWRPQLIDWLIETYGDRFTLFGGNRPGEVAHVVRGKALNQLYASTKVVVGDTFCPGFIYGPYYSDRVPETLGRGGFLIMPDVPGIEGDYFWGEHLGGPYQYDDFEILKAEIDFWLREDEQREKVRRAGHEHVKAHHTYLVRWEHILKTVFE